MAGHVHLPAVAVCCLGAAVGIDGVGLGVANVAVPGASPAGPGVGYDFGSVPEGWAGGSGGYYEGGLIRSPRQALAFSVPAPSSACTSTLTWSRHTHSISIPTL